MEKIITLPLGAYQTNCYLVWEEGSNACIVIDPGYEAPVINAQLKKLGLTPAAILLTHGHFDHVGAVRELVMDHGCAVYLHPDDTTMPPQMTAGTLYYTHALEDGQTLHLAGLSIGVYHTPGHTPGSVCLAIGQCLFTGDTLFAGSCGRTDLPGGNWQTLMGSLARLKGFTKNYHVLSGHGACSTLAEEKLHNPYFRG